MEEGERGGMLPGETFETPVKQEYYGFPQDSAKEETLVTSMSTRKEFPKSKSGLVEKGSAAGGKLQDVIRQAEYLAHTITLLCWASCLFLVATREYRLHMQVTQLETEECKVAVSQGHRCKLDSGNVEILRSLGSLFAIAALLQLLRYHHKHLAIKEFVGDAPLVFNANLDITIFISWYAIEGFVLLPVNPPFSNYEIDGNLRADGGQSRYHADDLGAFFGLLRCFSVFRSIKHMLWREMRLARSVHIARIMELSPSLPSSDEFAIRWILSKHPISFVIFLIIFFNLFLAYMIRIAELPVASQLSGSDFYFFWDCVRTVSLAFLGMLNEQSYAQSHFGQVTLVASALCGTVWTVLLFVALLKSSKMSSDTRQIFLCIERAVKIEELKVSAATLIARWWRFQKHHDNRELLLHTKGKLFPSLAGDAGGLKRQRVIFERSCAVRTPAVAAKVLHLAELVKINQSIRSFRKTRTELVRATSALRPVDRLVSSLQVDHQLQHSRSMQSIKAVERAVLKRLETDYQNTSEMIDKMINQAQQIYTESAVKISGLEQRSLNAVNSQEALAQSVEKVSSQVLTIHSTVSTRFNAIEEMIERLSRQQEVGRSTMTYHSTEFFQDEANFDQNEQISAKSPAASVASKSSIRAREKSIERSEQEALPDSSPHHGSPPHKEVVISSKSNAPDIIDQVSSSDIRGMLARLKAKSSN